MPGTYAGRPCPACRILPKTCLILLGAKSIQDGERILAFREGQSLLIDLDLLVAACVTRASPSAPHLTLSILRELAADAGPVPLGMAQPSPRKRRTGG
jgi:hypothetical protein